MEVNNETRVKFVEKSYRGSPFFITQMGHVAYYYNLTDRFADREAFIAQYPDNIEKYILELEAQPWGTMADVTHGGGMFYKFNLIKHFNADIGKMKNTEEMFYGSSIETFKADMRNVESAEHMFHDSKITKLNADMRGVKNLKYLLANTPIERLKVTISPGADIESMLWKTPFEKYMDKLEKAVITATGPIKIKIKNQKLKIK